MASTSPSRGKDGIRERLRNKQADRGREGKHIVGQHLQPYPCTECLKRHKRRKKVCWRAFYEPPKKATRWMFVHNVVFVPLLL